MSPPNRLLIRTAVAIQARYDAHANRSSPVALPEPMWQECVRAALLLEYARRRRWLFATEELRFRVRNACRALAHECGQLDELLKPHTLPQRVPSLRDLYDDLIALHDEYEAVRIDRKAEVLAIRTDPIVLEGIDLGPFEIRMRWSTLPYPPCYSIDALQPRRSAGEGYTHPHVLSERLCEGDGRLSIQHALADGRLSDFFGIVARVLETYNSGSAYCSLEDWEGRECSGCGDSISHDESCSCSRCETVLCSDCWERCNCCDELFCSGCVTPCNSCEDVFCRGCLNTCSGCEGEICAKCRQPHRRCRNCTEDEHSQEVETLVDATGSSNSGSTTTRPAPSAQEAGTSSRAAAVHADGMVQAAVDA